MEKDIAQQVRDLAGRVFRSDSKALQGFIALSTTLDNGNLAAYANLLRNMLANGIEGYSEVKIKYLGAVHGSRKVAECRLCHRGLKLAHRICFQGTKHGNVVVQADEKKAITIGDDHHYHMLMLAKAIEDKDFEERLSSARQVRERRQGERRSLDDLAEALGVDLETVRTLRYVQQFTDIYQASPSAIEALRARNLEKSAMNWLAAQVKTGRMPDIVREAYGRYKGWPTRDDATIVERTIKEGMLLPSGGLIPDIAGEVAYLAHPDCMAADERKAKLLAARHEEFKPRPLIEIPLDFTRPLHQTIDEKLQETFMTFSDAIALRQQLAGIKTARLEHNTAMLERYCSLRFSVVLGTAKGWYEQQKKIIKAWHAQHEKDPETADERYKWQMVPEQYRLVRDVIGLLEDAQSKDCEADLIRLIPMPAAQRMFRTLYLIEAKERLGISQRAHYAPASEFAVDVHRIRHTPLGPDARCCISEEKYRCNKEDLTVSRARELQAMLDHDELVPERLLERRKGKTLLEALDAICKDAQHVTVEQKATIDYIAALATSPLELGFIGLKTDGCRRLGTQPCFDIGKYAHAGYLLSAQARALERVREHIIDKNLHTIDLQALKEGAALLQKKRPWVYLLNVGPGSGHVGVISYEDRPAGKDSSYWQPFSYKHRLVEAASAMTTKQQPELFKELLRIQRQDARELRHLAEGRALASADVIKRTAEIVECVRKGDLKCDPMMALQDGQRNMYLDGRWFDVHAESTAEQDAKGEVIDTFAKSREHLGALTFMHDTGRFEARGLDKERLNSLLAAVATRNYRAGRQVYIRIDAAR